MISFNIDGKVYNVAMQVRDTSRETNRWQDEENWEANLLRVLKDDDVAVDEEGNYIIDATEYGWICENGTEYEQKWNATDDPLDPFVYSFEADEI